MCREYNKVVAIRAYTRVSPKDVHAMSFVEDEVRSYLNCLCRFILSIRCILISINNEIFQF